MISALTITDPWLKVLTAGYVLVGIGILVEIAKAEKRNESSADTAPGGAA